MLHFVRQQKKKIAGHLGFRRDLKLYSGTRLDQSRPDLAQIGPAIAEASAFLEPFHREYNRDVSFGGAAASLELSALIYACCTVISAKRVLDLGSGFTSFVLRQYQARSGFSVETWSVDDSAEWLAATGRYLESKGLSQNNLLLWDEFAATFDSIAPLDLVVLDVRPIKRRIEWLPRLLEGLDPRGILIADDMHKPHMRRPILESARKLGAPCIDCSTLTRDSYGRFSAVILRPDAPRHD